MKKWNNYIDRLAALRSHDPETYTTYGVSMFFNGAAVSIFAFAFIWGVIRFFANS